MATNTCCPKGYIYIDSTGHYSDPDPAIGSGMITNTPPDPFFNTCVTFANRNAMGVWVIASDISPIPCSCCPPNFVYSAYVGMCYSAISSSSTLPILPVPCIKCNCVTPPPPTCPDICGTAGNHINFGFNFMSRQCTVCSPVDVNPPRGKIVTFMPQQFSDPNLIFVLTNLNFI